MGHEEVAMRYGLTRPRWHALEGGMVPPWKQSVILCTLCRGTHEGKSQTQQAALCHEESKAHVECRNVSLRLSVLGGFWGRFGQKKGVLGRKMRTFGRGPPGVAPPPSGAIGEFSLNTWIWQGHHLGSRMARVE